MSCGGGMMRASFQPPAHLVDPDHAGAVAVPVSMLKQPGRAENNFNARSWINHSRRQSQKRLDALE